MHLTKYVIVWFEIINEFETLFLKTLFFNSSFLYIYRQVAEALLKHEVLTYEEIEELIGQRPYPDSRKPETVS